MKKEYIPPKTRRAALWEPVTLLADSAVVPPPNFSLDSGNHASEGMEAQTKGFWTLLGVYDDD